MKLHISAQSGPVILVFMYVCVYAYFFNLHITAQFGSAIGVILCHTH